ncbi:MAG: PAS domain-containing sensor histidine kinase [Janthinobacterium lividum]
MASVDNPLEVFFDLVPTGAVLYAPVVDEQGKVVDFRFVRLNPAAQRLLGLPAQPTKTFCQHYPHSVPTGIFAQYREAYLTGQASTYDVPYAGDGLDTFFRLVAQRSGALLVVNFTDMADLPRSAAEAALRDSQARERVARAEAEAQRQRLHDFMSAAPGVVLSLVGPQHVIEFANEGFRQQFGVPDPIGKPYLEAVPGAVGQYAADYEATALYDHIYRTGEPYYAAEAPYYVAHTPTGGPRQLRYFDFAVQAACDGTGHITGVQVYATDVTAQVVARHRAEQLNQELEARVQERTRQLEQKQAEALAAAERRAQEQEELYQVLAQTTAAIAITRGADHRYVYVNAASEALFVGRQLLGHSVAEALPEAEAQGLLKLLDRVYATGETFFGTELPLAFAGPAGGPPQVRYYNFTYQAYREQEQVVGISTFAYDVTEQVLARQEREAQQGELQRIFEQAPVAIAIFRGPQYIIELVNPAMCAIGERIQKHTVGKPLFDILPDAAAQGFKQIMDDVMATGIPYVAHELPSTIYREGRPQQAYWNFVYQPLLDAEGRSTSLTVVAAEVSEQVRARQQVQHLNQELQAANEELQKSNQQLTHTNVDLDNFIYTASHDLKAPIANIEGLLLLLLRKQLPAAVQQTGLVSRALDMMQQSVERFRLTIAQLTDLTLLQQVQAEPTQPVELATIVEAVRLDLAPMLEATGAQLTVDIPACATVHFTPQHLRSIVYNLLSNAIKYGHPDRVPQVQLRCHSQAQATVLEVADNGLGLSEQQQSKLFVLFQRLHSHVEGSGVGLYMVKRIVENAGGTITVRSQPEVGTTFTVTFPA